MDTKVSAGPVSSYSAACFFPACTVPDSWTLDTLLQRGPTHA